MKDSHSLRTRGFVVFSGSPAARVAFSPFDDHVASTVVLTCGA